MKLIGLLLLLFTLLITSSASAADWRWSPSSKEHKVTYSCATMKCLKKTFVKAKKRFHRRDERYDKRRRKEWKLWTGRYIPSCTWYGESGPGPKYAKFRYVMWNRTGSGARGKFQFMDGTYHNFAKYHDWSPLDQEIAARRTYWSLGVIPWAAC